MTENATTRLSVLFVGVNWPPETFLARLVRGLAQRDIRITMAVAREPDASWRSTANVDFLYAPGWSGSRTKRMARTGYEFGAATWRAPGEAAQLIAQARNANLLGMSSAELLYRWLPFTGRVWDIIYFPWNATAISHLPLMERAPTVISCRGAQINVVPHNPERAGMRDALAVTFEKAAAVHCVSEAIQEEATHYGLDPAKSVIIRPAVDPDVFRPATTRLPPGNTLRLIMTGSIIWRKGYEYALSAIALLRRRGVPVHLDIIGRGAENLRLLYTIDDLELADVVKWHGLLPPDKVVESLQQADVFLLSSLSEGISNAVLEAMACGLPVVTTDVDGMKEAVTDGVEGLLVPPRDAAAMADALAYLWSRPAMRQQMGQAGRERVLRDFRLEDQVSAFEGLFRSVA